VEFILPKLKIERLLILYFNKVTFNLFILFKKYHIYKI